MYNKLRKRFLIISLAIATGLLFLLIGGINFSTVVNSTKRADEILETINENKDQFEQEHIQSGQQLNPSNNFPGDDSYPYRDETFFSVTKKEDGTYEIKLDFINSINADEAISYYEDAQQKNKTKGYILNYRFLKTGNCISFLDCTRTLEVQKRGFGVSVIFAVSGMIIYFVVLYFASGIVFKNIKINDEKQKRFVTDASHQLKTPLMIISANNDLLEFKNGESDETKTIANQISQMNSMVTNLLSMSKSFEKGELLLSKGNISNIINEAVEIFEPLFENSGLNVETNIEDNIEILVNVNELNEILKIVFDNAAKYSKTYIKISLKKEKKFIEFVETNDSSFEEDKDLNYLSERFIREDNDNKNKSGSGIGISLLKSLVEKQEATLDIKSSKGNFILKIKFKNQVHQK